MKRLAASLLLLVVVCQAPAQAEDMRKYLEETDALVRQGRHAQALERMVWFHHHALEHDPSMYRVRLTTALASWKRLAGFYAPAQRRLERTRDQEEEGIRRGGASRAQFEDVVAINQLLGEPDRALELFEEVHLKDPKRARVYWDLVKEQAIAKGKYDLARPYIPDVKSEYDRVKATFERQAKLDAKRGEAGSGAAFRKLNEDRFVTESLRLVEMAFAFGEFDVSNEIANSALALVDDRRLRAWLDGEHPARRNAPARLPPAEDPVEPADPADPTSSDGP